MWFWEHGTSIILKDVFRSLHSRQGKRCCITRRQEVPGNRGAARSSHHVFGSMRPLPRSKISCSQTEGAPRVKRRMLHHRSWCSIQLGARGTTVQTKEDADTPFPNHARYSLRPANSFTESLVIQAMGCPEKVKVNGVVWIAVVMRRRKRLLQHDDVLVALATGEVLNRRRHLWLR